MYHNIDVIVFIVRENVTLNSRQMVKIEYYFINIRTAISCSQFNDGNNNENKTDAPTIIIIL